MPDPVITNVDIGNVIAEGGEFRDELLVFGGAGTVLEGTLLARQSVAVAVVAAPDGGNTGDGTATLATVVAGQAVPLVGVYNLECIEAVTNGGVFKLEDPNGAQVATQLIMTAGAGLSTIFEAAGLQFTVTDAAADFIVGDSFTLTVAADGKTVPFAVAGAGGAQVPLAIMSYDVVAAGAGNEAVRALVAGVVRKERLIIDADGDGDNITDAILDQLRDFTIVSRDVQELNIQDNQ